MPSSVFSFPQRCDIQGSNAQNIRELLASVSHKTAAAHLVAKGLAMTLGWEMESNTLALLNYYVNIHVNNAFVYM